MASVGERLRLLRESRNTSIESMAEATGIGKSYLDALERDEIHVLPGKAFGKLYIRAYAEVLEFDPQPWIDDYDREQRLVDGASTEPTSSAPSGSRPVAAAIAQWKASRAAPAALEPALEEIEVDDHGGTVEPEPITSHDEPVVRHEVSAPPEVRVPRAKRFIAPLLVVGVVAITAAIYFGRRPTDVVQRSEPPAVEPAPESAPPEPAPAEPQQAVVVPAPRTEASPKTPVVREKAASTLSVASFGVGRRVVNSRLEGEADRFAPWERACFATRVRGGRRGDVVRHVWLYEGRTEQSIPLRVGGPDWGTYSNKTLNRRGEWAVEARDASGSVLARVEFTCGP